METEELDFEAAYQRLEETVRILERGELPLSELVAVYEEGVRLAVRCNQLLDAAELRISQIVQQADGSIAAFPLEAATLAGDGAGGPGQMEGR